MVRSLDAGNQAAIRVRGRQVPRNFIVFTAKDRDTGDPVEICLWDDIEAVSVSITDEAGDTASKTFYGDGAVLHIDPIPMRIGLEERTIEIELSPLHETVEQLVREYDPRGAKVEIYRGRLDPVSHLLVAPPAIRFLGKINTAPITTAAAGGESGVTLRVTSHTTELTRTNPAKKSDAQQMLRSGDRFRRYIGIPVERPVWWGEEKSDE